MEKKIVIIQDDIAYFRTIRRACKELSVAHYPSNEEEFYAFSETVVTALQKSTTDAVRQDAVESIERILDDFIDGTSEEKVLGISDYHLQSDTQGVNGVDFCQTFFRRKTPIIFISDATDRQAIKHINSLAWKKRESFFLPTQGTGFEEILRQSIADFLEY